MTICKFCSNPFEQTHHSQKYCSDVCRKKAGAWRGIHKTTKKTLKKICTVCNKEFTTNTIRAKYCSDTCRITAARKQIYSYNRRKRTLANAN